MDVLAALHILSGAPPFDFVFIDPPYREGWEERVLATLSVSGLLRGSSIVIVEAAKDTSFDFLENTGFILRQRKEYKTNAHLFLQPAARGGNK